MEKDNRQRRATDYAGLSTDENDLLQHVSRWGSDGWPIQKVGRNWHWVESWGVKGSPTVYKTKRAAGEAFQAWIDAMLRKIRP